MQQGAESEPVQASLIEFLSLSEFLSKIGTRLLASSDLMEKNRNPLACLGNAGSYFAESYCTEWNTQVCGVGSTGIVPIGHVAY